MKIISQLRCETDRSYLRPVVITVDDIMIQFKNELGTPVDFCRFRILVETDRDADGIQDFADSPISQVDIDKLFNATAGQVAILENCIRGGDNLMSGIRTVCKNKLRVHNEAMSPGGQQETYADPDLATDTV